MKEFDQLMEIMKKVRENCPWDKRQTHKTLMQYLIEETYEVVESIEQNEDDNLKEELGDLLIQIIFHCLIAEEREKFNINDVITTISEKLIRRHPHVFDNLSVSGEEEVLHNWEKIKLNEGKTSVLQGVPKSLPALLKATRIQTKASRVGFDWDNYKDVLKKVNEELKELKEATESNNKDKIEEEIGDLLFSIVNISRFLHVNPEDALRKTINKFIKRFTIIEQEINKQGKKLQDVSLEEMDKIWEKSKDLIF
jgi:MazG family protein